MVQTGFPRIHEQFWYTHSQLLRRANTERSAHGLPRIQPLTMEDVRSTLGPGYSVGWFSWRGLQGRMDDCVLSKYNEAMLYFLDKDVHSAMKTSRNVEEFGDMLGKSLHGFGHIFIGETCSPVKTNDCNAVMCYSESSARDPIFYRWHLPRDPHAGVQGQTAVAVWKK